MMMPMFALRALANLGVLALAHLTGGDPVAALLRERGEVPAGGALPGRRFIRHDDTTSPMFMVRALVNLAVLTHAHLTCGDPVEALLRQAGKLQSDDVVPGRSLIR